MNTNIKRRSPGDPLPTGSRTMAPMRSRNLWDLFSAQHHLEILRAAGHTPRLTPTELTAAFGHANVGIDRQKLINQTKMFFSTMAILVPKGLENVPSCWISQLPRVLLSTCKPHWDRIPYMITGVAATEGVLCIRFAQDDPADQELVQGWDELRIQINLALTPNLWRLLKPRHEQRPNTRKGELREQPSRISL